MRWLVLKRIANFEDEQEDEDGDELPPCPTFNHTTPRGIPPLAVPRRAVCSHHAAFTD